MKILLIEDEPELRKSIRHYLELEGNVVEIAADFSKAEDKTAAYDYDCVLVDITLPDGNGLNIISQLKQNKSKAGIIIISAKNSLDDKVTGLDIGSETIALANTLQAPLPHNLRFVHAEKSRLTEYYKNQSVMNFY